MPISEGTDLSAIGVDVGLLRLALSFATVKGWHGGITDATKRHLLHAPLLHRT